MPLHGPVYRKHNAKTTKRGLEAGIENEWLGPYRDECIIGEHPEFIQFHNQAVEKWFEKSMLLPVPYSEGFGKNRSID